MGGTRVMLSSSGDVLAERVRWARLPRARVRGLLDAPPLEPGEALVISPAPQVHTAGMRYAIDVVFCDRSWVVLHVVRNLRPWRVTRWVRSACYALELRAGAAGPQVVAGARLMLTEDDH